MNLSDLITEQEQNKYTIFCDMDGVLTDFSGDFIRLAKEYDAKNIKEVIGKDVPNNLAARYEKTFGSEAFWNVVKHGGIEFWSDMSWNPGGKKLWNYISKYSPNILTAPSKRVYDDCVAGKKKWIKRLGSPKILIRSKDRKKEFAKPNHILIDDLKSNINDWNSSGGIGIHHKKTSTTLAQLKELGL